MAKSKNSGFTLMELILVVVILGIAASFAYLSISNIGSTQARKAATDTDYLLSRCRAACLSRSGDNYLRLYQSGDKIMADYCENGSIEQHELGDGRVSCAVDGSPLKTADATIRFERSTGAEQSAVQSISFSGGSSSYTVKIVPSTGSHIIE